MSPWTDLADRLRSRYPDDWAERLQSYREGTNRDLHKWQALGNRPSEATAPSRSPADRYMRIRLAARSGLSLDALSERFGMTPSSISNVLARFGERASR